MKKNKMISLALILVLLSLFASACNVDVKTEKSESYTDANGNTTTTTTTNDNGNVTTETKSSSDEDEEYDREEEGEEGEEGEEEGEESAGVPDDVAWFAESLDKAFAAGGTTITVPEPEDQGEGKYTTAIDSDRIIFTIQTDGRSARSYAATIMGDEEIIIKNIFGILVVALLDGDDEMMAAGEAVVSGESPVLTEAYTFTAVSGEIEDQPFTTLTAVVN